MDREIQWSGSRTRDRLVMSKLLYPTELSSGGDPGVEPGASWRYPHIACINRFRRRGMRSVHKDGRTGAAGLRPNRGL